MKEQIIGWFVIISWILFIVFLLTTDDIIFTKIVAVSCVTWKFCSMIHKALKE
jgi:hypothetical protein